MNADKFLDTNILVYAYDLDTPEKRETALQWVKDGWQNFGKTAISVQVLQELAVNLQKGGLAHLEATQIVRWPWMNRRAGNFPSGMP